MKRFYLISLFLTITLLSAYAQVPKPQIRGRLNFCISPRVEGVKVAKDYNLVGSLGANIVLNNSIYLGGYFSKKTIPMPHTDLMPGYSNDVSFQHLGIDFGGHFIKLKRKGSYVVRRSKLRATMGIRIGGGIMWLNDDNWNKVSSRDYFYIAQPHIGVYRKFGNYVIFTGGVFMQAVYSVDKLGAYFSDKDFLSPGVFMTLNITTFK